MFWKTILIYPLANALVFFVGIFGGNVGLGIIALTVVVKTILLPLSYKATIFQMKQQKLQPLIKEIQEKYKDKKEQSEKIMALYREHNASPLGCLVIFIQLPILIALYQVIIAGITEYQEYLYPFITMPESLSNIFLGIHLDEKSIIIAVISGVVQFAQIWFSPAHQKKDDGKDKPTTGKPDIASSMQTSMKYTIPILMVVIGITLPAALSVYIIANNIFTLLQDQVIKKILKKNDQKESQAKLTS